jgi:hypothetical protein
VPRFPAVCRLVASQVNLWHMYARREWEKERAQAGRPDDRQTDRLIDRSWEEEMERDRQKERERERECVCVDCARSTCAGNFDVHADMRASASFFVFCFLFLVLGPGICEIWQARDLSQRLPLLLNLQMRPQTQIRSASSSRVCGYTVRCFIKGKKGGRFLFLKGHGLHDDDERAWRGRRGRL